ncbi:uncharacterized protein IUM83_10761 [Phytophthora cinnamomi]|uniref:uncharacterized protein n=1 Tax=Phytophthora cinnamomi TaxID=4785 RepID=UPI0035593B5F|nr:hypothetical protein IUM83_10761 [Phytophthora cinnamomi]
MSSWSRSLWASSTWQRASLVTSRVSIFGPRLSASLRGRAASAAHRSDNDATWLYELQLSRPLPVVDISRTPLSQMLPESRHAQVVRAMHKVIPVLVRLNRASILVFGSILFLPARVTRPWIPLLAVISLAPPLSVMLSLSLEILELLLRRSYEFWFVSVLNVVNWVGIAQVFGDFRALVCVSFWLNSQNVISIDANYRTYQTTVKSIVMAGPSMLALVFCCSYRIIVDAAPSPSFWIGSVELQWRQVVIFTASTLIVFMFKKAYAKVHRRRHRERIHSEVLAHSEVAYANVFIPVERSGLRGRDLVQFHVGHNVTVLNTKSILLNRLFIMFFWMQRHAWDIFIGAFTRCWRCVRPPKPLEVAEEEPKDPEEEELSTMRGSLEYFCPFETFPGIKRRLSSLRQSSSSARSISRISASGRHRIRRLNSAILLSGVVVPKANLQQKQRKAFGQRSGNSQNDSYTKPASREKKKSWTNTIPGMIHDE